MTKIERARRNIGRNPIQHSRVINLSSLKDKFIEFHSTSAMSNTTFGTSKIIMKPCEKTELVISNGVDGVVRNGHTKSEGPQIEPAADVKVAIMELVKEICSHVDNRPNVTEETQALQSEVQSLRDEMDATKYELARISTDLEYSRMKEVADDPARECTCCEIHNKPGGGGDREQEILLRAMDDMKQDIENFKHDWAQELQSGRILSEITNSVSSELRAREAKARNLIVYGLPEEECEDSYEQVKTRILSLLGLQSISLFQAKRLGVWTGVPRPLLLTFSSETDRLMILQNKFQLNYLPEAFTIRICEDLTPFQRAQLPAEWKKVKAARKQQKRAQINRGLAVIRRSRVGRGGEQPHTSSKHMVRSRKHPYRYHDQGSASHNLQKLLPQRNCVNSEHSHRFTDDKHRQNSYNSNPERVLVSRSAITVLS